MPIPIVRPSLIKDLETRYGTQRAGGAFDVKKTLGQPGTVPVAGTIIDNQSQQSAKFQSPNGFEVKVMQGVTQVLDAIAANGGGQAKSRELSTYIKGLDTTKYRP
jgi:hypothetical protein